MSAEEKIRNRQLDATIKRTILENIQNKNVKLEKDRNQIIRKLEREKLKWRKTVKKVMFDIYVDCWIILVVDI